MSIADEKYVALTTYRRNGESSSTPVWIADLGDATVGFTTPSGSLKVTRINHDGRVALQPSDARGNPKEGTEPVSGRAQILKGDDFTRVRAAIKAKYGVQVSLITALGKLAKLFGRDRVSDCAVVITPD